MENPTNFALDDFVKRVSVTDKITTEASTLEWKPGFLPKQFTVRGLGNGRPFLLIDSKPFAFTYLQEFGCLTVLVFND